jgi:hypothetical protein
VQQRALPRLPGAEEEQRPVAWAIGIDYLARPVNPCAIIGIV